MAHHRNGSLTPPASPDVHSSSSSHSSRPTSSQSSASSAPESIPPAPHPSADQDADTCPTVQFAPQAATRDDDPTATSDIFKMPPTVALTLLARSVELIVSLTPENQTTSLPPVRPSAAFSNISANPTWVNPYPGQRSPVVTSPQPSPPNAATESGFAFGAAPITEVDGVFVKRRTSSNTSVMSPDPLALTSPEVSFTGKVVGEGVEQMDNMTQYTTITRKFWSKTAPPVSIEEYLFRIHRYCPLSTAVYLAASLFLYRLSVRDQILPMTPLSVHRILIAALRVSAKSLEDCSHSQRVFSKVGGLSEAELSKLEISFCFLMQFDLKVDKEMLQKQAEVLRRQAEKQVKMGVLGLMKRGRLGVNEAGDIIVRERSKSRQRTKSPAPRKIMMNV